MKTISKRIFSVVLAFVMIMTMFIPSFAADSIDWEAVWGSADAEAGVIMFVGSNESERNFSWYSDSESEPCVKISTDESMTDAKTFKGECVAAPDGDYANKVTVTGLSENTIYYYQCVSEGFESDVYSFRTEGGNDFSAIYVTDIHITQNDDSNENSLKDTSNKFSQMYADALEKNSDISVILSTGDQATEGLESEYKGLTASPLFKTVSFATTMGNHDRKGVAYRTFKNVPNEDTESSITSYIGNDYWFVKGDVLFLVMDSNSGNGDAHADFIEAAIEANPDVKWKVMMCHHDLYSGRIPHRESENKLLRMIWGPIADEYGIDLVLLGHSHYYTVTNVLYANKTVADLEPEMVDPAGTLYMVSCSITRPRSDDDIGLNEEWIGAEHLTENATYNILDFTEDSITVNSYEVGSDESFNSFTITKTTNEGGHEETGFFTSIWNTFVRKIGAIYALFNNIGVYSDLKDNGYDVGFFDVLLGK